MPTIAAMSFSGGSLSSLAVNLWIESKRVRLSFRHWGAQCVTAVNGADALRDTPVSVLSENVFVSLRCAVDGRDIRRSLPAVFPLFKSCTTSSIAKIDSVSVNHLHDAWGVGRKDEGFSAGTLLWCQCNWTWRWICFGGFDIRNSRRRDHEQEDEGKHTGDYNQPRPDPNPSGFFTKKLLGERSQNQNQRCYEGKRALSRGVYKLCCSVDNLVPGAEQYRGKKHSLAIPHYSEIIALYRYRTRWRIGCVGFRSSHLHG